MVTNIRKLYYYRKDSGLEVDFVMRYKGECTLVEVKADTSFIHGIFADGGLRVLKKVIEHQLRNFTNCSVSLII